MFPAGRASDLGILEGRRETPWCEGVVDVLLAREEGTVLPLDATVELADTLDSSETLSKVTCRVGRWGRLLSVLLLLL